MKVFLAEGTLGQPDLLDLGFVVLFTRRSPLVAFRVEFIWVLPVKWVSAGFNVRRKNSTEGFFQLSGVICLSVPILEVKWIPQEDILSFEEIIRITKVLCSLGIVKEVNHY
jgi:hypothetical protein